MVAGDFAQTRLLPATSSHKTRVTHFESRQWDSLIRGAQILTWTKFNGKWVTSTEHWITNSEAGGIFVALEGGSVTFELNNLTDKSVPADFNEFVHFGALHVFGDDEWTGDLVDAAVFGGLVFEICVSHCICFFS